MVIDEASSKSKSECQMGALETVKSKGKTFELERTSNTGEHHIIK
jgi:hypothetical protein